MRCGFCLEQGACEGQNRSVGPLPYMNNNDSSRLPKWPFLLGDAALLATAGLIANYHPHPFAPLPFVSSVLCVVLGTAVASIPFLAQQNREEQEAAENLRQQLA